MHLQIIIGSVRQGRAAKPVADWAFTHAKQRDDMTVELVDLKNWPLPMFNLPKSPAAGDYEDEQQQRWAKSVERADAYLFVCPEYNHGYSAVLKNALDYVYAEWGRKPAGVVSYGGVMGARAVEQLRQVMVELQMAPIRNAVHIAGVHQKIENGAFSGDQRDADQLQRALDDLAWWGNALHWARRTSH
ncbi:NAD(P)H-dependent oxidoreductase [Marinobacterium sp. D7]|uniref:NADPH-dependent FMN reductase n=1 Tax=Marinobacterium ramblicola TaxID=2849041 RepID=UPI001C2D69B9|nr:NADPH-dependent FMN reductase [Marinobacterium ramblicola]MBV1786861.1 NAD(P)H-dependent oxidoreductase [Marinobacterium ramblicola]